MRLKVFLKEGKGYTPRAAAATVLRFEWLTNTLQGTSQDPRSSLDGGSCNQEPDLPVRLLPILFPWLNRWKLDLEFEV